MINYILLAFSTTSFRAANAGNICTHAFFCTITIRAYWLCIRSLARFSQLLVDWKNCIFSQVQKSYSNLRAINLLSRNMSLYARFIPHWPYSDWRLPIIHRLFENRNRKIQHTRWCIIWNQFESIRIEKFAITFTSQSRGDLFQKVILNYF